MHEKDHVSLIFTCDFDAREEWEAEKKGYFTSAAVQLPDGTKVPVCFWDPVRLSQELEMELKWGGTCFSEPGMIVIPKVTVENMKAAVEELFRKSYFDRLLSLSQR
jgi:hypothetical protein